MKKLSFVTKSIMETTALILLVGIILIASSIKIQDNVLTSEMEKQATSIAEIWGKRIDPDTVKKAAKVVNYDHPSQNELTSLFNEISATNPNVAQGYLFTSKLIDGNKSAIIANPTHIVDMLKESDIKIGDLNEHPEASANAIKEMNKTKKITASEIYQDKFGTWITVMYPIKNSSGEVFAFFGVDVDASMVKNGTEKFLMNSLLILIPSIIIVILIQVFVTRRRFQPLQQLVKGIIEMRKGNLDIKLPIRGDDLGNINGAFNDMASELKLMMVKIRKTSDAVLQSSSSVTSVSMQSIEHSEKISGNIKQMTTGIQAQEISVNESAEAVEQIASEINNIAISAQDVTVISREMEDHAMEGLDAISEVVKQMAVINDTVKQSSDIISLLKGRSDEISSILDVITGISDQTNLLALNAAIEAARAGENGKGFAVVAQEVKKLAEESSKSTEKIATIIEEIQNETNNAVNSMEHGTKEAEKGTKIAETTGELFFKIKTITDDISNQIEAVSAASQEISAVTEEVAASVKDLTEIANNNTNFTQDIETSTAQQLLSINQLSSSSKELNDLAHELQVMIAKFKA